MSRKITPLTVELARQLLAYSEDTGVLSWRVNRQGHARAGDAAGCVNRTTGYVEIGIGGLRHQAHRIAWLISHGAMPAGQIDHIDGNRGNNRLANLRDVSPAENRQNLRRAHQDNRTGLLGVRANGKRFSAQIQVAGTPHYLGTFDTPEQAHAAYIRAKREMHPCGTV